mgnify:CR=1 FL=1
MLFVKVIDIYMVYKHTPMLAIELELDIKICFH